MTKKADVIAVNTNKGGTLKTTTVINLAGVLSNLGYKVLIIDADNQSNTALSFGVNPDEIEVGLFEVLVGRKTVDECIIPLYDNIDLLPATDNLIGFEFAVINKHDEYPQPFNIMRDTLSNVRGMYDYIFVDTPPSMGLTVANVFNFANKVIIPYHPEIYSMRSLVKVVDTIKAFKAESNPDLDIVGVVITKFKSNTTEHRDIIEVTKEHLDSRNIILYETYIPESVRYSKALSSEKRPPTLIENDGKGVHFELLWEEMIKHGKFEETKVKSTIIR